MSTRRQWLTGLAASQVAPAQREGVQRFVRFLRGARLGSGPIRHGLLEGDSVRELAGSPFLSVKPTGTRYPLKDVRLLAPCEPPKILAVGLNYRSHIGNRPAPKRPEIFYKPITCLQHPDAPIVIPKDATNVHSEGELVIIIGKTMRRASKEQARAGIFGYSCGNDVSDRDWQNGPDKDLQWWRAKGADTFGPLGPAIVRGVNGDQLQLRTRLNGSVVQEQTTADLLFDTASIVSFISQYVTLLPGDAIYTGTPGATKPMKPGDVVEVEIEGIGTLKNPVAGE